MIGVFHPGETVVHSFVIPFPKSLIQQVIISYRQSDDIVFERPITRGTDEFDSHVVVYEYEDSQGQHTDENKSRVWFQFTQIQSVLFKDVWDLHIQLNVITVNHSRHTSKEIRTYTGIQHIKEAINQ